LGEGKPMNIKDIQSNKNVITTLLEFIVIISHSIKSIKSFNTKYNPNKNNKKPERNNEIKLIKQIERLNINPR
jgi:hypothetical protein